jgi:hypothetical protein
MANEKIKIYLAAYKDFKDYEKLEKVLDYMLHNKNKNDVLFYVSYGERGDSTCMKYVKNHGYEFVDWCSNKYGNRAEQKLPYIQDSTHSVLVTDGVSRGIGVALRYSAKYVKGKIVLIKPLDDVFSIWQNGKMLIETRIQ